MVDHIPGRTDPQDADFLQTEDARKSSHPEQIGIEHHSAGETVHSPPSTATWMTAPASPTSRRRPRRPGGVR